MVKATYKDKILIVSLLSQAFKDNQSVNFIIRQDKYRTDRINALMDYSFEKCFHFGEVYISEDRSACVLLLIPGSKQTSVRSIWQDVKLIFKAIGIWRIHLALKREAEIKKRQFQGDMVYLWFIGVDLTDQHKGNGTQLLNEVIARAQTQNLPVCLETSTLKNLPWYKRFRFEIYGELDLGYKLFFLKRNPGN